MLANAIKKGAKEQNIALDSTAMAYGQHKEIIADFDLIILAPQMASMLSELESETDGLKAKAVSTTGIEYVSLTREPAKALEFVFTKLN